MATGRSMAIRAETGLTGSKKEPVKKPAPKQKKQPKKKK